MRLTGLELRRQLLHMTFGIVLIALLYFGIINNYHMVAILLGGLLVSKLCTLRRIPLASWVMDRFERKEFRTTFPGKGPIFFMIGSIIVLFLFPLNIALAAMVILSVGDAISHMAGIIASFFGVLIFVNFFAALAGTCLTLFFEDLKLGIEDNLFIPIVAAIIMSLF